MNAPAESEPLVLTVPEVARALRISRTHCYEALRTGEIPGAVRLGRSVRLPRAALLAFLQASSSG